MRTTRLTMAIAAAAVAAVLATGLGLAPAPAQAAEKWPTKAEVDAAKKNASASKREYAKLKSLVARSHSKAVTAAATALEKQNDYAKSERAAQAATVKANQLQAQADAAKKAASQADRRFGEITSQLYLAGGNSGLTTQLLFGHGDASALLARLSAMSRLTDLAGGLQSTASQQANVAASLSAQAAAAQKVRQSLAAQAKKAAADAAAAQSAANDALAASQKASANGYKQMAELTHQSAALQAKYAEHQDYLAALARQRAAQGNSSSLWQISRSITADPAAAQAYARSRMGVYGWGGSAQWGCLFDLWTHESGWRVNAYNVSSAAYGIPQAWPGQKMASAGSDWMTNYRTQINWGMAYIAQSYGTPCGAWSFEMSHTPNWY